METAVEAQTKPVPPHAPLAHPLSVKDIAKANVMMFHVLSLIDSEIESKGAVSENTVEQVRNVIGIVQAGAA